MSFTPRYAQLLGLLCLFSLFGCAHAPAVRSTRYHEHTRPRLDNATDFAAFCAPKSGRLQSVKFVVEDFQSDSSRVHFLDGHFYTFHDEWFWYQVLNGIPVGEVDGFADSPGFDTPADATQWAQHQTSLPLDLRFAEERLYSDQFYVDAMVSPRHYGVGALVSIPAGPSRPAAWGFELEYTDVPTRADVERFARALLRVLPSDMGKSLRWLTRSSAQAELGAAMRKAGSVVPVMSYTELASVGESEVYSTGLRVGRLLLLDEKRSTIAQATSNDVLVAPLPLDDLPPAAGLISQVPLTPLSHFNVLARQRGIPSVYVGGIAEDPYFGTLIAARAPVLLDARPDGVWMAPMSEEEYRPFNVLERTDAKRMQAPDSSAMPYVRSLDELASGKVQPSLQEVGGKMLGFVTLATLRPEQRPDPVAAITVRAYAEHVAPLMPTLRKLLENAVFQRSERLRLLTLEGPEAYAREFPSIDDRQWAASFDHSGGVVAEVIAHGGVQAMLRAQPIEPRTLTEIRSQLASVFKNVSRTQGLRLRSSSTLEDIERFNGAGLYDSSTGFLDGQGKKSLETGIKKTWASYWNYRAFEERRRARIDSLAGRMAVVVHPRFDDAQELANAVVTFTRYAPASAQRARMEVNAQHGALSVTNPPVDNASALPEVTRVDRIDEALTITRLRPSTEVPAGERVFDDAALREVFAALEPLAVAWLERHDRGVEATQRARMVTLDLELRRMAPDWATSAAHEHSEPRWIIKQVRSLDPPAAIPELVDLSLPLPRDVLLRTVQLSRRTCEHGSEDIELIEAYTAADQEPDLGYAREPFIASVTLLDDGRALSFTHLDFEKVETRTRIVLRAEAARRLGKPVLEFDGARCTVVSEAAALGVLMRDVAARARRLGSAAVPGK